MSGFVINNRNVLFSVLYSENVLAYLAPDKRNIRINVFSYNTTNI